MPHHPARSIPARFGFLWGLLTSVIASAASLGVHRDPTGRYTPLHGYPGDLSLIGRPVTALATPTSWQKFFAEKPAPHSAVPLLASPADLPRFEATLKSAAPKAPATSSWNF